MNEDQSDDIAVFDLDLDDQDLIQTIKKPINDAKAFWNDKKGYNLEHRRERNTKYWKGQHYDDIDLYEHNVDFANNRIFTSIETIIPHATSRIHSFDVIPANDSVTSQEFAKDLGKIVSKHAEKDKVDKKLGIAARNLLLKYGGILKQRFDPKRKRGIGEITTDVPDPDDIIIDHQARLFEEPRFIAHAQYCSVQELVYKFPDKEDEILKHFNIKQQRTTQMTKRVKYWEVWFTFYTDDGESQEGLAWLLDWSLVLGKMRNPNYIYEDEDDDIENFFDAPQKPFYFMNLFSLGDHKIDPIGAIDNAIPQQKILNKRGRQIIENADQSGSGIVYNTQMISKEDMAKLIGAPDEKIGVKGEVTRAITRISPPLLPNYVLEDKYDARNEIDNTFATHAPSRGDNTNAKTLGQDVLQIQQDNSRQDEFVRAVDDAADWLGKHTVQMMKVYYTEEHYFPITGDRGEFDLVSMKSDDIEDGIDIDVVRGSSLPVNKQQNRADAQSAAQVGYLDPLTYHEVMQNGIMPSPNVVVERLIDWMTDPIKFVRSTREDEFNREAMVDIRLLNEGENPDPRSEPTVEYLNFRNKYIMSGDFQELPSDIQQAHVENLEANIRNAQRILSMVESQLMTPGFGQDPGAIQAQAAADQQMQPQQQPQQSPLMQNFPGRASNTASQMLSGLPGQATSQEQELV